MTLEISFAGADDWRAIYDRMPNYKVGDSVAVGDLYLTPPPFIFRWIVTDVSPDLMRLQSLGGIARTTIPLADMEKHCWKRIPKERMPEIAIIDAEAEDV